MNEKDVNILRRTFAKYIQFSFVLLLRDVCEPLRNRFPTIESLNFKSEFLTE